MRIKAPKGQWLSLDEVIGRIAADAGRAAPSIAFAISGGGATGAYEAGVLEAWLERVQTLHPTAAYLRPRFVLGSSAGALNATTVLVSNLRPGAGPAFGFEVWRSICPRASPYVVGGGRSCLLDLATRWVKVGRLAIFAAALVLLFIALLIVNPVLSTLPLARIPGAQQWARAILARPVLLSAAGALVAIAVGLLVVHFFRDAVFGNAALKRTLACVLDASCNQQTGRLAKGLLRRRRNPIEASQTLVNSWYRAANGGRINFIVTATDLSTSGANLFTLVEPEVFQRLAANGWQVMQVAAMAPAGYRDSANCGWVSAGDFVTCVVASTSIPGVFPSQRLMLHSLTGKDTVEHDFVDGGVLNNTPIHIAIDAGATHVVSLELEPLRRYGAFMSVEMGNPPNLGRNVAQTFETLLSSATRVGIRMSSSWNRQIAAAGGAGASGKRLVPIFRMAPRRRELNLIDFNGHYQSALSKVGPSLEQWLTQGLNDAKQPNMKLFWDATFQPDP